MPEQTPEPDEFGRYRVTDKDTGHKRSIPASALPHGNFTVLKQPASDPLTGEALPTEFNAVKPVKSTSSEPQSAPAPTAADQQKEKNHG